MPIPTEAEALRELILRESLLRMEEMSAVLDHRNGLTWPHQVLDEARELVARCRAQLEKAQEER